MILSQTVEQLEAEKCATAGTFSALTSNVMLVSHFFLFVLIIASFVATLFAFMTLWKNHVFSDSARILLSVGLVNGVVHQFTVAVIRGRALHHAFLYYSDACSILFHSSECVLDNYIYLVTGFFASAFLVSLFIDRLLSLCCHPSTRCQRRTAVFLVLLQIVVSFLVVFEVFRDVQFVGYVPVCSYPTQPALSKFYLILNLRLIALCVILLGAFLIRWLNMKKDKVIVHNVYDTNSRYKSYENLLTTNAVCFIISAQFVCLASTSAITEFVHVVEDRMSEAMFHCVIAFMTGTTYSNLSLPILVCRKTSSIIENRRKSIEKNRAKSQRNESFNHYFEQLDTTWGRIY